MLTLLHGDPILSRPYLSNLKNIFTSHNLDSEIITLNGPHLTLIDIIESFETANLFGSGRLIVIEDLFRQSSKTQLVTLIKYLNALKPASADCIIWESRPLSAAQLKRLPLFTSRLLKTPPLAFKLLDTLQPGQASHYLPLLTQLICQEPAELVLHLLARQTRLLLCVSHPLKPLPTWQITKLNLQAKKFKTRQLTDLHSAITELDWRLKSGQTVGNLSGELSDCLLKSLERNLYATS